jgi:hypothetical protein
MRLRITIILLLALGCVGLTANRIVFVRGSAATAPEDSKEQPKGDILLDKKSKDAKYKEVPFNHDNHTDKNYSPDGTKKIDCTHCHHTDQPAAALKTPFKKSERAKALTTELLKDAAEKGVKTCRTCHLQVGETGDTLPSITYEGDSDPTPITNDIAYHKNCNACHDEAIAARPALKCAEPFPCAKGTIPGGKQCYPCHKPPS